MNIKNIKSKFKGLLGFNKYTINFILIYFLMATGVTYAYYAYQIQEETAIVGNVVAIDADLEVELVVGENEEMVPLLDAALSNALNGVGSPNGACIDSLSNLSCQVYKITLINNGVRLKHLNGTIELYAKNGGVYNNLKWQELKNPTTIKEGSLSNDMTKSTLVSDLTIESKEEMVWYIAVWISETGEDQINTNKGDFGGTVTFSSGEEATNVFTETILAPNAQTDADIDFGVPSSSSGTNGIYLRSGTENDAYPIYYYRGAVDNNLIFAGFCWKVVRTTETGGLKLIYNGTPTDGTCDNTGEATQIGTSAFNTNNNSLSYVGYMYSNSYVSGVMTMSSVSDAYVYGNSVTYSNGIYTLVDTISDTWSNIYENGLSNNHYTCFSTEKTCERVAYINDTDSTFAYCIVLTGGVDMEEALTEMLGADDENTNNYNITSSDIKGNKDIEGTLDYWYYNYIELEGYNSYIEDTVWCYDRSLYSLDDEEYNFLFNEYGSAADYSSGKATVFIPNMTCSRNIDKFTVSTSNGNGNLDYPVGLLTYGETILAGGAFTKNDTYYLYTGQSYWSGSPMTGGYTSYVSSVFENGFTGSNSVNYPLNGVRPSVSLKPGFSLTGNGDGTVNNPYVVQ